MTATRQWLLLLVVAALVGTGAFVAGRSSAHRASPAAGYDKGHLDGYFDGLRAGEAQGREEGRADQAGVGLPADARQRLRSAFEDGYTAGANDVFAGYDGGWTYGRRYVITVAPGAGSIVYRIAGRDVAR